MSDLNIKVLHEPSSREPYLVIDKPAGLASAPLVEGEDSAYTQSQKLFPSLKNVDGRKEIEHGLLHRIDTPTRGLLLIASTNEFYNYMTDIQKNGLFTKTYTAQCQKCDVISLMEGYPPPENKENLTDNLRSGVEISSLFRPYSQNNSSVRPVNILSGKAALKKACKETYSTFIKIEDDLNAVCTIKKGYRHQVRCHLSWIGYPITGDNLYNPLYQKGQKLCFTASAFSFPDMTSGKITAYSL